MNDKTIRNEEIFELYKQKLFTIKQLAYKYKVSRKHLRAVFTKNNIDIWEDEHKKIRNEYIEKYRQKQMSREEIRKALKKSRSAVDGMLRSAGLEFWDANSIFLSPKKNPEEKADFTHTMNFSRTLFFTDSTNEMFALIKDDYFVSKNPNAQEKHRDFIYR